MFVNGKVGRGGAAAAARTPPRSKYEDYMR